MTTSQLCPFSVKPQARRSGSPEVLLFLLIQAPAQGLAGALTIVITTADSILAVAIGPTASTSIILPSIVGVGVVVSKGVEDFVVDACRVLSDLGIHLSDATLKLLCSY